MSAVCDCEKCMYNSYSLLLLLPLFFSFFFFTVSDYARLHSSYDISTII